MPSSAVLTFADPSHHQASIQAADIEMVVTACGKYDAELKRLRLHQLWMQRSRQSLPYIARSKIHTDRRSLFFLTDADQQRMLHSGMTISPGDIVFSSPCAEHYHRTLSESRWAAMSLRPDDLAAAGHALLGYDLSAPAVTRRIRPPAHLMSRLLNLHKAAGDLAETAPDMLAHPEVAKAMEQALLQAMVACLTSDDAAIPGRNSGSRGLKVMRRFAQVLEANQDRPLYVVELCAQVGVSERMLRWHCQEHLGMSPHRYLWLRRMHLIRRALALADPKTTTVTTIANDQGFGELGRFSVTYRELFGESPSATLRRAPEDPPRRIEHPETRLSASA